MRPLLDKRCYWTDLLPDSEDEEWLHYAPDLLHSVYCGYNCADQGRTCTRGTASGPSHVIDSALVSSASRKNLSLSISDLVAHLPHQFLQLLAHCVCGDGLVTGQMALPARLVFGQTGDLPNLSRTLHPCIRPPRRPFHPRGVAVERGVLRWPGHVPALLIGGVTGPVGVVEVSTGEDHQVGAAGGDD